MHIEKITNAEKEAKRFLESIKKLKKRIIDEKDIDYMIQKIISNFFKVECKDCSRSFLAQKDYQHPKEAKVCPYCNSEDIFIIDDLLED